MALVVQHNLNAINANNKLATNVVGVKKATEKLSSGFRINRAGDDAAGLAISEKMRSQIRGLGQAIRNANDGISLIQTAEGGLNETHAILQRMRELAVQSSNGTYSEKDAAGVEQTIIADRDQIQLEIEALKSEIDRISTATEYNGIKLLDGSLGMSGSAIGQYGPRFGVRVDWLGTEAGGVNQLAGTVVTSSINGVTVQFTTGASGKGGENAVWNSAGTHITINLTQGVSYTQAQIDGLIGNAKWEGEGNQGGALPQITVKLGSGVYIGQDATIDQTARGVRSTTAGIDQNLKNFLVNGETTEGYADTIQFTSNNYGPDDRKFAIATSVAPGKEWVEIMKAEIDPNTKDGEFVIHLATGVEYTSKSLENILRQAGLDYTIDLSNSTASVGPEGFVTFYATTATGRQDDFGDYETAGVGANGLSMGLGGGNARAGVGVGADLASGTGVGLTFQIGANGVADQRVTLSVEDMGAGALGVANLDASTKEGANAAINLIDIAISKVSFQRAGLGALQNRLESTVNNLTATQENLTAAESQIRDTDMAQEMINYTKFSILQQAAQAMLAQANQAPQAILQLLG